MADVDTKGDDVVASAADSSTSEETQKLSPLQQLDKDAEVAYKTLKSTGKLPDDIAPEVAYGAQQKKIARDSQAAYTKNQQELVKVSAEHKVLRNLALQAAPSLTNEQQEELEDLKFSDPDEWRVKLNQYEQQARQGREDEIAGDLTKSSTAALEAARLEQLKEYTQKTGIELTDDIIANDIPPRITQQLQAGEITFTDFLNQAGRFLGTEKVIHKANEVDKKAPGFDDTAGSQDADNIAVQTDFALSYAKGEADF